MKMIIAIIRDDDSQPVSQALIKSGFKVTTIASTGGFLHKGSSTLFIGLEEEKVDEAIQVIRETTNASAEPGSKRATLFVLNIEQYSQI